jgi:hypothetical protein
LHIYVTVGAPPYTTLTTPLGTPLSLSKSINKLQAPATFSLGFNINVFPSVIANGNIHNGTIAGKLKGAIPAHTPNGTLYEYKSTFLATFSQASPSAREVKEQACSTTS